MGSRDGWAVETAGPVSAPTPVGLGRTCPGARGRVQASCRARPDIFVEIEARPWAGGRVGMPRITRSALCFFFFLFPVVRALAEANIADASPEAAWAGVGTDGPNRVRWWVGGVTDVDSARFCNGLERNGGSGREGGLRSE